MEYRGGATDSSYLEESEFRVNYLGGTATFTMNATIEESDSVSSSFTLNKLLDYSLEGVSNEKEDGLSKEGFIETFESEVIKGLTGRRYYFSELQE